MQVVAGLILSKPQQLLVTLKPQKSWLSPSDKQEWEFPGGKIEKGETPEEALHREIREELSVSLVTCRHFRTLQDDKSPMEIHFFSCQHRGPLIPTEHRGWAWCRPKALLTFSMSPLDQRLVQKFQGPLETLLESPL